MAEFAAKEKTKENLTGIPMQLKERMEQRTGVSFDDVRVHYNSDMPARLGALAYTQGNLVEIGPGQESHLPHELGHVVQQKLGLVRANAMHPSGVAMNTEEGLERQADRIGAGGYIGNSPSGNAGTDIVQRYVVKDNCTFAQAPVNEDKPKRKVMVKNGEPASVYFEESVSEVGSLKSLGIVKTGDDTNTVFGTFYRFAQRQIPDVRKIHQTSGCAESDEKMPRLNRLKSEKKRAKAILKEQLSITNNLLDLVDKMRTSIIGDKVELSQISEDTTSATKKYIELYQDKRKKNDAEYIPLYSLGKDITLDIFTLRSLAERLKSDGVDPYNNIEQECKKLEEQSTDCPSDVDEKFDEYLKNQMKASEEYVKPFASKIAEEFQRRVKNWRNDSKSGAFLNKICGYAKCLQEQCEILFEDKPSVIIMILDFVTERSDILIALNIMMEDLAYRKAQIEEEMKKEVVKYVPQLRTACDKSADDRRDLSSLQSYKAKFTDLNFGGDTEEAHLIGWEYHVATPVPLSDFIGPDDCLFIEDAAGKSTHFNELANAHWRALIYGRKEVEKTGEQEDNFGFNKLSKAAREKFCRSYNFGNDSKFTIKYEESAGGDSLGVLEIVVKDNKLVYRFTSESESFKLYMKHFLLDVAKTVTDKFVLRAFNTVELNSLKPGLWNSYLINLSSVQSSKRVTIEHLNPNQYSSPAKGVGVNRSLAFFIFILVMCFLLNYK